MSQTEFRTEYRKNGVPWQDQLKVGDEVMIDRWSPQENGLFSVANDRSQISSIESATLTTVDGEIFDRQTLRSVDFANPGHKLQIRPVPEEIVATFTVPRPTIEDLMQEGMLEQEARDFLDMIIEGEKER